MENKIINNFLKFIEGDLETIKKDLEWFGSKISNDLEKLTIESQPTDKKDE
tara:strand:- start:725 stop:877 length:153 start_codon:yes stop_codon:yes gene_type:complete